MHDRPRRQRCLIVLPSSGVFDSRAYRIASTLAARGHDVTVLARREASLATEEDHPAGYRIVRVAVSAVDGLPAPLASLVWRLRRRRPPVAGSGGPPTASSGTMSAAERPTSRVRRAVSAARRLAAIGLTVRSQTRRTLAVAPTADLVHAMAYMGVPVGLALGRRDRAAVIYDARDIYVDAANVARLPRVARALFGRIERGWARRASRVVTVNEPYARVMAERFGVDLPLVVLNCSYRRPRTTVRPRRFHDTLGLASDERVVLYQGGFSRDRGIEQLIEALQSLPGSVHLVLLGYGRLEDMLRERATDKDSGGRLHVLPAVAPTELLDWVASADVVAMPIQPSTLNHRLTTPNKLFEAMAAGVPVVASDLPGMAGIVRETACGLLVDPTDSLAIASAIRAILDGPLEDRVAMARCAIEAHETVYNWERQAELLLAEYTRLTGQPW